MNAKNELKEALKGKAKLKCAILKYGNLTFKLNIGYNAMVLDTFFKSIDFDYDGCHELFGTIWLIDGSWLNRVEYDGGECWGHYYLPDIPNELLNTTKPPNV